MKITELKINPRNPQKFTNEAIETLMKSIKTFPKMLTLRKIIYDPKTMYVLGGNKRLICLQKLGYKEIPDNWIKSADELTEDEKKRFTVQDNIQSGTFDFEILDEDFEHEELEEWGLDFGEFEEEPVDVKEDNYEIPEEIKTDIKEGDFFEIGNHFLLCGNATKLEDCERLMQGNKGDMLFTDPPFDFDFDFDFDFINGHLFYMNSEKNLVSIISKHIDLFSRLYTVDFRQAHLISNKAPMTRCDYIAEFLNGKTKFNNLRDGFTTLIECAKIHKNNDENFGHKQAKKIELPSIFIEHYSNKNEIIVDLFGGSGSTMAAAEQLSRKCYMMELEPKNCQIIINRMQEVYNLTAKKIN